MSKLTFEDKVNLYNDKKMEYQYQHYVRNIRYYMLMLNI